MTNTMKPDIRLEPCGYCLHRGFKCNDYQFVGSDIKSEGRMAKAHAEYVMTAVNAFDAMREALEAALAYDAAIQRHAQDESWVASDELDRLYDAWISKSRGALAVVEGKSQ